MAYAKARRSKTFIIKPDAGCQGRGIYLIKHLKDIKLSDRERNLICQVYIARVGTIINFSRKKKIIGSLPINFFFFINKIQFFTHFSFLYILLRCFKICSDFFPTNICNCNKKFHYVTAQNKYNAFFLIISLALFNRRIQI